MSAVPDRCHRCRDSMFVVSDAVIATDDVVFHAERFADAKTRSLFYGLVIAQLKIEKLKEDDRVERSMKKDGD